jgi:hypothetical protein
MFGKYLALPLEIEAVQFTIDNKIDIIANSNNAIKEYRFDQLLVITLTGDIVAVHLGMWIVKEPVEGYYYPITDEQFKKKYVAI